MSLDFSLLHFIINKKKNKNKNKKNKKKKRKKNKKTIEHFISNKNGSLKYYTMCTINVPVYSKHHFIYLLIGFCCH